MHGDDSDSVTDADDAPDGYELTDDGKLVRVEDEDAEFEDLDFEA